MKRIIAITILLFITVPAFADLNSKSSVCAPGDQRFYVAAQIFSRNSMSTVATFVCSHAGDNETEDGIIRIGQSLVKGENKNTHWAILSILPLKNK